MATESDVWEMRVFLPVQAETADSIPTLMETTDSFPLSEVYRYSDTSVCISHAKEEVQSTTLKGRYKRISYPIGCELYADINIDMNEIKALSTLDASATFNNLLEEGISHHFHVHTTIKDPPVLLNKVITIKNQGQFQITQTDIEIVSPKVNNAFWRSFAVSCPSEDSDTPRLLLEYSLALLQPILGHQHLWSSKWNVIYGGYTFLIRSALDLIPPLPSKNVKMLEYSGYTTDCTKMKLLKILYDEEREEKSSEFICLSRKGFQNILVKLELISDINEADFYFRTFDLNNDGVLDWDEFLSGIVAADTTTAHGGLWNTIRSCYIFHAYNQCGSGLLSMEEFFEFTKSVHLAANITNEATMISQLKEWIKAFNIPVGTEVLTIDDFTEATGKMIIRGTSRLLRFNREVAIPRGMDVDHAFEKEAPVIKVVSMPVIRPLPGLPPTHNANSTGPLDVKWGSDGYVLLDRLNIKEKSHGHYIPTVTASKPIEKRIPGLPTHMKTDSGSGYSLHNLMLKRLIVPDVWSAGAHPLPNGFDEFPFSYTDILALCESAKAVFSSEPAVLEVPLPARIFGDLHGQYADLMQYFLHLGSPVSWLFNGDISKTNYLFLGDYVDRGKHSLETICVMFALKLQYPANIFLIRGNHEDAGINCHFGFLNECMYRLGKEEGSRVFTEINNVFAELPMAAVVGGSIFCVHGGPGKVLDIKSIVKAPSTINIEGMEIDHLHSNQAIDLLWSDPSDVPGITPNGNRGAGCCYGPDIVHNFLRRNNMKIIVRAHEVKLDGIGFHAEGQLVTLFSATHYCGRQNNCGAVIEASVEKARIPFIRLQAKAIAPTVLSPELTWNEIVTAERPPTPVRD